MEISKKLDVSSFFDWDDEICFTVKNTDWDNTDIYLTQDEIIKLRNHLNTIIDGIK